MLRNINTRTKEDENFDALCLQIREKLLNPILQVNLQEMCLRKIVVSLWNTDDMLISIQNFLSDPNFAKKRRETLELQVKDKVFKLSLPERLKKELLLLVKPIGWEIVRWRAFHELLLRKSLKETINKHVLKQLHWTCIGSIDYVKTMHELLRLEVFDVEERYVLACGYCFENEIRVLWEQLPEERKCEYGDRRHISKVRKMYLEYYWPYVLKGEEHLLPDLNGYSFNKHAFKTSASLGNKMGVEHFFHKLTSEERASALLKAFDAAKGRQSVKITLRRHFDYGYVRPADVVYLLLTMMNLRQLKLILLTDYYSILLCLRHWPWHELFLDVMNLRCTFLPDESTAQKYQMQAIWNNSEYSPHLFQKVFKQYPKCFGKFIVTSEIECFSFFREFFIKGDAETLKVVFETLDMEDRLRLVSCNEFIEHIDRSIMRDEWNLFEACFGGFTLSEEDKNGLMNDYKKFLEGTDLDQMAFVGPEESREDRWKRAFDLLHKIETGASNKRNLEDGIVTKEKRICNEKEKNALTKS